MSTRAATQLAWFVCLLCVTLAAGSLLLGVLNGRTLGEIFVDEGIVTIATLTVTFSVVGAMISSHRPGNPIGWIFCAAALFQGLSNSGYEYATYAFVTESRSLPLAAEASWIGQWIWAPGLGLILVFLPLLFPDGRLPSRRWRPVAWLGGLSIGLIFAMGAIVLWPDRGPALVRPEGVAEEGTSHVLFVVVEFAAFPIMLVAGLGAVISLFVRFRRARGDERQQIKWFASAAALTLFWTFLLDGVPEGSRLFESVTALGAVLLVPSIPVATGIAIFRYRLYDIDRLINRTLVYAALTGMLVAVYVGGVVLFQTLFHALAGGGSQLAIVASTLVIAVLFNPLRRRIQGFIDRRFYRKRYDAAQVLAAFSVRLREETDLDVLKENMVSVARETIQPEHVGLWLREPMPRDSRGRYV